MSYMYFDDNSQSIKSNNTKEPDFNVLGLEQLPRAHGRETRKIRYTRCFLRRRQLPAVMLPFIAKQSKGDSVHNPYQLFRIAQQRPTMQFWSAGDGGGGGAIPPNSETSNKVVLGPEKSASTPSATTLLEEASRTHSNAQRSVAAAVETIRAGTSLAIADDDIPLEDATPLEDAAVVSCIVPIAALSQWILPLHVLVWSTVAAIAAVLYQWTRALPLWSAVAAVVSPPAPPPPRLSLWSTVAAMVSHAPPPPPCPGVMQQLYQWMNSLRSALAAVVEAHPLLLLAYYIVIIVGLALLLLPSRSEPLPRRARRASRSSPSWVGGDSPILAAKRGERPSTGGGSGGGGGGGASSAIASGAEGPSESDPPATAASAVPEPILPALLATGPAIYMMINKAPAPAPALMMSKLFFVSVLLASLAVVKAERIRHHPHEKVDRLANEHAIDVARPSDHQMEEAQKDGKAIIGKLIRCLVRNPLRMIICCDWCTYSHALLYFLPSTLVRSGLNFDPIRYDTTRSDTIRLFHYVADRISRRTAGPLPDTASTASNPLKRSVSPDVSRPDPSPLAADDVPLETAEEASVDIGVLEAASVPAGTGRRLQATPSPAPSSAPSFTPCPDEYVYCVNGNEEFVNGTVTGQSCYEACTNGTCCCNGDYACKYATACIEKNITTPNCYGTKACYKVGYKGANPPITSGGSCSGDRA